MGRVLVMGGDTDTVELSSAALGAGHDSGEGAAQHQHAAVRACEDGAPPWVDLNRLPKRRTACRACTLGAMGEHEERVLLVGGFDDQDEILSSALMYASAPLFEVRLHAGDSARIVGDRCRQGAFCFADALLALPVLISAPGAQLRRGVRRVAASPADAACAPRARAYLPPRLCLRGRGCAAPAPLSTLALCAWLQSRALEAKLQSRALRDTGPTYGRKRPPRPSSGAQSWLRAHPSTVLTLQRFSPSERVGCCPAGYNRQVGNIAAGERFDPREGRWAPVTPLSAPRYDLAAAALGTGRLLALGGLGTNLRPSP
jgi:hypothetical protein